ncbi:MAG: hypothetical protein AAF468_00525 [Pseudomonadota bacterium]
MKPRITADFWLALFFLASAILLIVIWIPLDTGTGLTEKVRRKLTIGDALGPTIAGVVIALGAVLTLLRQTSETLLTARNVRWMASLLGLFALSLILMRYVGPIIAAGMEDGYRPLRATPPWNYAGFLVGGTLMIGGLTGIAAKKFSLRDFAIGFAASLIIALFYDLPFDDLVLPPNGDV